MITADYIVGLTDGEGKYKENPKIKITDEFWGSLGAENPLAEWERETTLSYRNPPVKSIKLGAP